MNLLKALNALNPQQNNNKPQDNTPLPQKPESAPPSQPAPTSAPEQAYYPNVMQSVLVRHEAISNRIKSKK